MVAAGERPDRPESLVWSGLATSQTLEYVRRSRQGRDPAGRTTAARRGSPREFDDDRSRDLPPTRPTSTPDRLPGA